MADDEVLCKYYIRMITEGANPSVNMFTGKTPVEISHYAEINVVTYKTENIAGDDDGYIVIPSLYNLPSKLKKKDVSAWTYAGITSKEALFVLYEGKFAFAVSEGEKFTFNSEKDGKVCKSDDGEEYPISISNSITIKTESNKLVEGYIYQLEDEYGICAFFGTSDTMLDDVTEITDKYLRDSKNNFYAAGVETEYPMIKFRESSADNPPKNNNSSAGNGGGESSFYGKLTEEPGGRVLQASMNISQQGPKFNEATQSLIPEGFTEAFCFDLTVDTKAKYDLKKGALEIFIPQDIMKNNRYFRVIAASGSLDY